MPLEHKHNDTVHAKHVATSHTYQSIIYLRPISLDIGRANSDQDEKIDHKEKELR